MNEEVPMNIAVPEGTVFTDNTSLIQGERFLFNNALVLEPGAWLESLQTIVELFCLYDHLAVDDFVLRNTAEAMRVRHVFSDVLVGISPPFQVYETLLEKLTEFRFAQKTNHDDVLLAIGDKNALYEDALFFQKYENHPVVSSDGSLSVESLLGGRLRNSDDHFLRTMFYHELARSAGIPYVPHQCRVNFLIYLVLLESNPHLIRDLNLRINRDGWSVQRAVLSRIEDEIIPVLDQKRLGVSLAYLSKLGVPPLARYFQNLLRSGRFDNLAEAIMHERNERDCRAFRKWCNESANAMRNNDMAAVDRSISEFDKAIQEWTAKLGVVERVRRTKIVLGTLVGSEMTIPDPVIPWPSALRRKKHLLFLHKLIKA